MQKTIKVITSPERHVAKLNAGSMSYRLAVMVLCALPAMTCAAQVLVMPNDTITALKHTYALGPSGGPVTWISDGPASGQYTQPGFTATLTGSETVDWSVEAAAGEMFVVSAPPSGFGNAVTLSIYGQWLGGPVDSYTAPSSVSLTFQNLVGPIPSQISADDAMGQSGNLIQFGGSFSIAPGTEFTGVELSAQYDFSVANPVSRQYNALGVGFSAYVDSMSESLSDGTLMTIEAVPEPTSVTLMIFSLSAFACSRLVARRQISTGRRRNAPGGDVGGSGQI